jgi:hypothetical protein
MRVEINGKVFDLSTGAEVPKEPQSASSFEANGRSFVVGKVYSSREREGVTPPAGFRWSSMMFGLDANGGVNRALERVTMQSGQ